MLKQDYDINMLEHFGELYIQYKLSPLGGGIEPSQGGGFYIKTKGLSSS